MLLDAFVGVRNVRSLCLTSSGMLLSYRLGCDCAWYAAIFVVVYGPGLVHQRVQRGAVGLGRCRYALACIRWCSKCQVVLCLTSSGMLLSYRLGCDCAFGMQLFLRLFMGQGFCAPACSAWRCWSR